MNYSDKTREELLKELSKLGNSNNLLRKQYSANVSLLELMEARARKSEEKFRKTYMTSPDSVNINRLSDGMFVSVNEGFTNILGYTEEETLGKTSLDLNIWADTENRNQLVIELKEKGKVENFEANFLKKDKNVIVGLMSASIIDIDGIPHILSVTKDITSRKRIEEVFLREQFLMNSLMNNLTDRIYFKDLKSRFIRANKSMAQLFRLESTDQIVGKTDFDFFSREHAEQTYNDEMKIISSGSPVIREEKETWPDHPDTWASTAKFPLTDKNGNIIGTFGISRDITQTKKAEEQLATERKLLRSLIDNMPDRVYAKDLNSRFIICNNSTIKRMGKTDESELLGKTDMGLLPPELSEQYYNDERDIFRTGEPLINKEESILTDSGSRKWTLVTKVPLRDPMGNIIGLAGIGRDITDRKRKELESQVLFEISEGVTTTNNLDELMKLIHSSLGKVVYAENFFVALYNHESKLFSFPYFIDKVDPKPLPSTLSNSCTAYVFRTVKPLLLSQDLFDQLVIQNEVELIGTNSPSWIGIPLQTPSKVIGVMGLQHYEKENVYSESDVRFLHSVGNQVALAIERKIAEDDIKMKNEMLQATNAEKDKFFSILAHDLRGPLSAFVSATDILTEDIMNMTLEEIRDITISMKTDASNIYKLLENLLEWSRLKRGVLEFTRVKFNLKSLINSSIDSVNASAINKKIRIEVSVPENLEVMADKHMLETVVRNFISNAVKFTPAGGQIYISASDSHKNKIEIKVRDTGIGMNQELLSKLFILNEKTNRNGTAGEPSTGLGLMLCKEFVEKHGGKIVVESSEGKGSTFSFTI
jgi:two-component system, sensor histidine kinase and response regulator